MSSEQYGRLIEQLRVWCSQDRGRQQTLATRLGVSRQSVSAWLNESRMMSLDQYFEVQAAIEQSTAGQFLKDNSMTTFPDMTQTRPPAVHNSAVPRTLASALEALEERDAVIAELRSQLKSGATAPAVPLPPSPAAATRPKATAVTPMTAMEAEIARASAARMEGLSSKPLAQQTVRELQAALNNAQLDDQATIYNELQKRRADARLLNPHAPLGGR